jgi:hypothetical protein
VPSQAAESRRNGAIAQFRGGFMLARPGTGTSDIGARVGAADGQAHGDMAPSWLMVSGSGDESANRERGEIPRLPPQL